MPEQWSSDFTEAGANHLLAISGLHVGFILMILLGLFKVVELPVGFRNMFITMFIIVYIVLTGVRASVLRAGLLSILFLWAPYFKREGEILNILGITALINLIINPYSLFSIGFQLTYTVLVSIILWTGVFNRFMPGVLAVSLAAQLGSIPITSYYFNSISPVGILTNIWAIPLAGIIVFTAFIGISSGLITPVLTLGAARLVQILLVIMKRGISFMAGIPGGYLEVASPVPVFLFIMYFYLFLLPFILQPKYIPLNVRKKKTQVTALVTVAIIIIFAVNLMPLLLPGDHELEIMFFSVGQGDGILLELPDHRHIIVDGGGFAGRESNQGEMVILPYLQKEGIKEIDMVFITHFDTDHALGITSILQERDVKLLVLPLGFVDNVLSRQILAIAGRRNIPVRIVKKGDGFRAGDVVFQIFNPVEPDNYYDFNRNDNSIVLRVNYRRFSILLTGDLGQERENDLVRSDLNLKSDILKLGHHGSGDSSGSYFLQQVSPREAVISVGKNNYGHPAVSVLNRLKGLGIRYWRTDKQGAVIIKTDGDSYQIRGFLNKK